MAASLFPAPVSSSSPYRRWSLVESRWLPVEEAVRFNAQGFEGVEFFTCAVHEGGVVGFGAFDARTGLAIGETFRLSRPLMVEAARRELKQVGRERYEARVKEVLAARGGAS